VRNLRVGLIAIVLSSVPLSGYSAQPNVLLIITDDQGYGDFSIHGNPHLQTPHIDKLGESGVRFDRFFVNSFCAPTRAALLTGRWPLRTGCHSVTHNREAIRPSEITIAESLKDAGYRTACIGKWHNGEQYPFTPQGQGFDHAFGFNNGHWNNYFDATLLRGTKPESTKGYISDVLTDEALAFISARNDAPFFCYLAYNAPHSPYQVPDEYFDKFKAKGFDERVAAFYGMCENIDDNVGRLLSHLDSQELADNTIVLFLTDNGGTAGVKSYNAGMRGGKTSVHEGGTRVPLFMRWPHAKWKPHVAKPIVSHIDLYPTILDLCSVAPLTRLNGNEPTTLVAGINADRSPSKTPEVIAYGSLQNALPSSQARPKLDGMSLRPLLENSDDTAWPDRTLFTHNPIDETNKYPGAVRTQRHRLVREIRGASGGSSAKNSDESAIAWQLYDMESDPGQAKDIADEQPELVKQLSQRYDAWFADISSEGLQRFRLPIGYSIHNPVELHAPQAFFDKPLQFANGPGFANDWLTGWTRREAKVWFEIDVVAVGDYAVEIDYACLAADAGSKIRLMAADQSIEATIQVAPAPEISLAHRDADGASKYRNRKWFTQKLGTLRLPQGPTKLTIEPIFMPGTQVIDFKQLKIIRL